jgi:hypothetical protein
MSETKEYAGRFIYRNLCGFEVDRTAMAAALIGFQISVLTDRTKRSTKAKTF